MGGRNGKLMSRWKVGTGQRGERYLLLVGARDGHTRRVPVFGDGVVSRVELPNKSTGGSGKGFIKGTLLRGHLTWWLAEGQLHRDGGIA